jgi:hypothetical protein
MATDIDAAHFVGRKRKEREKERESQDVAGDVPGVLGVPGESFSELLVQILPPFLVAGLGMVGAGCLLDHLQHRIVFKEIPEIFILVPALLGLKGNLEVDSMIRGTLNG